MTIGGPASFAEVLMPKVANGINLDADIDVPERKISSWSSRKDHRGRAGVVRY